MSQVKGNSYNCKYSEHCEENFSMVAGHINAKSHPVILGKMQYEPVAKNMNLLPHHHIGLYKNL